MKKIKIEKFNQLEGDIFDVFDNPEKYFIINGDEINPPNVLIHGANCFNMMGAGIAVSIKIKFPEMFLADKNPSPYRSGDIRRLGGYTVANLRKGKTFKDDINKLTADNVYQYNRYGVNLYSQYHGGNNADLCAIRLGLRKINIQYTNCHIILPLIGCGIGGLQWFDVRKIVEQELTRNICTVVHYNK